MNFDVTFKKIIVYIVLVQEMSASDSLYIADTIL